MLRFLKNPTNSYHTNNYHIITVKSRRLSEPGATSMHHITDAFKKIVIKTMPLDLTLTKFRRDIDRKPENALFTARIEAESGIRAAYYFRMDDQEITLTSLLQS